MGTVPAILRYGRHYGICYDQHQEHPFLLLRVLNLFPDLTSLPDLPSFSPPHTNPLVDSKLLLSQEASKLLLSATTQPTLPAWSDLLCDGSMYFLRKVEPPLLLTNHGRDMEKFLPKKALSKENIDVHFETVDEDNDEGLSWPTSGRALCAEMKHQIAHEKVPMTKQALQLLKQIMRDNWTLDDQKHLVRELLTPKKPALQPISPLLLPDDAFLGPVMPSSSTLELALTSDPASLTSLPVESPPHNPAHDDFEALFKALLAEPKMSEDDSSPFNHKDDELIDYDAGRTSSTTVSQETDKAKEEARERRPQIDFVSAASLISHISVPEVPPYQPNLPCAIPLPPVEDNTAVLFQDDRLNKYKDIPAPNGQKGEVSPTKSVTFANNLATIIPTMLHGVKISSCTDLLADRLEGLAYEPPRPKNVVKSHQMLWRPEKLPLLEKNEGDDEDLVLDSGIDKLDLEDDYRCDKKSEMTSSLLQCSSYIDEKCEEPLLSQQSKREETAGPHTKVKYDRTTIFKKRKPLEEIINDSKRRNGSASAKVKRFSASGALSSFLGTRLEEQVLEFKAPDIHEGQAKILVPGTPDPVIPTDIPTDIPKTPSIPILAPPRTVFFSTTHLRTHRSLLRFFETWAAETLRTIFRELDVPMLLSPKHAVILTTSQALTQRPLPGQGSTDVSPVHEQVSRISKAGTFECVIVLVSSPTFEGKAAEDMLDFTRFCEDVSESSACQVKPWAIPAGEANLRAGVAKLILEFGFRTENFTFDEEETHEEKFLVSAGMNAFAGQVVKSLLQDDESGRTGRARAFVHMDAAEREERFGDLMGRNVLDRVGRYITEHLRPDGRVM